MRASAYAMCDGDGLPTTEIKREIDGFLSCIGVEGFAGCIGVEGAGAIWCGGGGGHGAGGGQQTRWRRARRRE